MLRKSSFLTFFCLLAFWACNKAGLDLPDVSLSSDANALSHEMIQLGDKLDNPYTTENVRDAYVSLYQTKAREEIKTTNLYVRFLPENDGQYDILRSLGLDLMDHPLDYEIVRDGDYYHDPSIPEDKITWQYAVIDKDFVFPEGITHEIIDECFLSEHAPMTKATENVDWDSVEKQAFKMTGNERFISEVKTKAAGTTPSGRITIVDEQYNSGRPFGVSGVCVVVNRFVKIAKAYTDRDGYYSISTNFSSNLRYRLMFDNEKGFDIGVNLVLVPASISTLGTAGPEGLNYEVTKDSERKLFLRCATNNAAYDYIRRCSEGDMDITVPPSGLRFWILNNLNTSSAVMMHHGAVLDNKVVKTLTGPFAKLIQVFSPDITIGADELDNYADIYKVVTHESAHASHFAKVGTDFWNPYIHYVVMSSIKNKKSAYGDGTGFGSGNCEVGEMWAYFVENRSYKQRYGGDMPTFGTSWWFSPQIFSHLEDRGLSMSQIFKALDPSVTSLSALKDKMRTLYPSKETVIEQVFSRYDL